MTPYTWTVGLVVVLAVAPHARAENGDIVDIQTWAIHVETPNVTQHRKLRARLLKVPGVKEAPSKRGDGCGPPKGQRSGRLCLIVTEAARSHILDGSVPRASLVGKPKAQQTRAVARPCTEDAECVAVPQFACPCSGGGKRIALHRADAAAWRSQFKDGVCPSVISEDPSCTATPKCENGTCTLVIERQ
jgi:hypothetical protein